MLRGKHILLGITGSIAAYKAAVLSRLLIKEGAEVKVVMTEMSKHFITPLTMATLSKNPVLVEFYNPENGDWNSHVSMGLWADAYIIAPASANTIAKMAAGIADNLLLTTYLSARCPVMIAPAMDLDMFKHNSTQTNLKIVADRGVSIVEPSSGELASGLEGKGRMAEPEEILFALDRLLTNEKSALKGRRVLINAGPTREEIDRVRYISNYSSGKMGYSIAREMVRRGAIVDLVSGPVSLDPPLGINRILNVNSAEEMQEKTLDCYKDKTDIVILCAAVSDYKAERPQQGKLKRDKGPLTLNLVPTKDIAASLGEIKVEGRIHIGFALEADNEIENAKEKIGRKGLDAIILNSMNDSGAGFGTETNKISIISSKGDITAYPLKSKEKVASDIADFIENLLVCSKA
jgi:phosphopantothenoylcysteine decarboxylase/phosphopantothenate--cysteine ligase